MFRYIRRVDARLMSVPAPWRVAFVVVTLLAMAAVSVPKIPRPAADFSRLPLLRQLRQPDTYGTDTIADLYEAKVVLNDIRDMYTKAKVAQTPLEARTWSKEASAPYPPVSLLIEAALYKVGEWTGVGFYWTIFGLACLFLAASLALFWTTRWYLFPLLYLNFSYFSERFVYVQDCTYLVMLAVVIAALWLARRQKQACHALMALAITIKLSPLYYVKNLGAMRRRDAAVFFAIITAGLVLPVFLFDNYLYIYRYGSALKGNSTMLMGAVGLAVPFAGLLWYVESRAGFDMEDRVGWGLVPVALFLGFKMNVARHLLVVLLVPDKRGLRNLAAAVGLAVPALLPRLVPFNSSLAISAGVLCLGLIGYLDDIGWDVVRDDLRHPARTARLLLTGGADRRPSAWLSAAKRPSMDVSTQSECPHDAVCRRPPRSLRDPLAARRRRHGRGV